MPSYKVRTACEVLGKWRDKDAVITADAKAVRELVAPFGNVLVLQKEDSNGAVDRSQRRKRENLDGLGTRPAVDPQNPDDAA